MRRGRKEPCLKESTKNKMKQNKRMKVNMVLAQTTMFALHSPDENPVTPAQNLRLPKFWNPLQCTHLSLSASRIHSGKCV